MLITGLETNRKESDAVVEALLLQDSANVAVEKLESLAILLKADNPDFTIESTDVIRTWILEIEKASAIIARRGGSENFEPSDITTVLGTIRHRTRTSVSVVYPALEDGDLRYLLPENYDDLESGILSPNDAREKMSTRLKRASAAIGAGTYTTKSFLLMSEVHCVNVTETGLTLAGFTDMKFSSTLSPSESEIINSPISNPLWVATIEELVWNAAKYGATAVRVWKEGNYFCFGNNGTPLAAEQVAVVNGGGVRLYKDVEGTGKGMNLIRAMGFEYKLRPATPDEQSTNGITTVAQIKPSEKVIAESQKKESGH